VATLNRARIESPLGRHIFLLPQLPGTPVRPQAFPDVAFDWSVALT
jgi:hypothetical protein